MAEYPIESWKKGFLAGLANPQPLMPLASKPTAYLYNDVRFIAPPEWDAVNYPNAVLCLVDDIYYFLCCKSDMPYVTLDAMQKEFIYWCGYFGGGEKARYAAVYSAKKFNTEWNYLGITQLPPSALNPTTPSDIIWHNCPIYYKASGELYQEASAPPTPVFE